MQGLRIRYSDLLPQNPQLRTSCKRKLLYLYPYPFGEFLLAFTTKC